jgi:hypothetical protein
MIWFAFATCSAVLSAASAVVQKLYFILTVALLMVAYRFTQLEATKLAPVALVLVVKRTSILYATFFGGKLYSDDRLAVKLLAGLLIVVSEFIILRNVG